MKRLFGIISLCLLSSSLWAGSLTITAPATSVGGTSPQWTYNQNGSAGGVAPTSFNTSLTLSSTHTVILASATAAGVTLTLPAASNNGQILQITKVDASTFPITIVTKAGDLIAGTTGTLTLNAIGQADQIIAEGGTAWWPFGQGLQITPEALYIKQHSVASNYQDGASSDEVICAFDTTVPVVVTGYRYDLGSGSGQIAFGILDKTGNLLTSTGPVTAISSNQFLAQSNYNLPPGNYNLAVQLSALGMNLAGGTNNYDGMSGCSRLSLSTMGISSTTLPVSVTGKSPGVSITVGGQRQSYK